ncbi:Protein TESPA1 [Merluccius polli]|uniref:Protein TESPA1 n=1 Tax=Merluccius polli TaxID=89951 RepID=A0AA47NU01_MERPO|nr:Protein TESPA1 [Merluccius polli]
MASSCPSSSTLQTGSSVSEVLESCSEDAEETLFQLGFGRDEPQVPARVPVRFFTFPSQLQGINFRLFLQSQLQRIREEDPNLSIASRFRQVEVLTAMANAFYSLYSHVSRTPLSKLTPPEPNVSMSPVDKLERFRSVGGGSVRSEPRSPVERLKETVSKMCLYTGGGGARRDSDGASPLASPRKRPGMPEVVDIVLENAKLKAPKKLYFLEPSSDGDKGEEEHRQQAAATDVPTPQQHGNTGRYEEVGTGGQSDTVESDLNGETLSDLDKSRTVDFISVRPSLASSLSGKTESHTKGQRIPNELGGNRRETQPLAWDAVENPTCGIKVNRDSILPAMVEKAHHHAPFGCSPLDYIDAKGLPRVSSGRTTSPVRSCLGPDQTNKTCEPSPSRSRGVSIEPSGAPKDWIQLDSAPPCLDKYGRRVGPTLTYQLVPRVIDPPCGVTRREEGDVTSLTTQGPAHSSNGPEQALAAGTRQLLSPLKHSKLKHVSNEFHQANSFEMEEVSSAGEEDFGKSKAVVVMRGDSMQSDSSGYAEEEGGSFSDMGVDRAAQKTGPLDDSLV